MKKIVASAVLGAMMALGAGSAMADAKNPKIGFSIDDLRLERWARDRDTSPPPPRSWAPRSTCNRPTPASSARFRRSKT
jgi:hypothetical protein